MSKRPAMPWFTNIVWEDMTPPGQCLTVFRCEIGHGFWVHVNYKLHVGGTYTATVKHAGGLCVSKSGFRKFRRRDPRIPLLAWARRQAEKFTRETMDRMEKADAQDRV